MHAGRYVCIKFKKTEKKTRKLYSIADFCIMDTSFEHIRISSKTKNVVLSRIQDHLVPLKKDPKNLKHRFDKR